MSTSAGMMLLVVAVIAVLAVIGAIWALRGAPQTRRARRRRSGKRAARPAAVAAAAHAAPPGVPQAQAPKAASEETAGRIEAMRALLHRGDEKARRSGEAAPSTFADTQMIEDGVTLPMHWAEKTVATPGPADNRGAGSGHIPL